MPTAGPAPALTTTTATDPSLLHVSYWVDGETTLAKLGSSLVLGRGRFDATVNLLTGAISGKLMIPPSAGTFLSFGFVPVTATTALTAPSTADDVTGTFQNGIADVTASELVGLSDTSVNGGALAVGTHCRTAVPAAIRITGPLNLLGTSHFTSTFGVPPFSGCGATEDLDPLFDGLVAGPNNVLATTLTFRCSGEPCVPAS